MDQLQESLSTRQSTTNFAHAGVSTIAALLIGGASGKLFYDSLRTPVLAWGAAALSLALLVYAFRNYRTGRKVLVDELKRYESMLELRRQLRLDDPAALLPR
ncbi:hypothetical protein [Pyxidicoccus xibeiensis]|uniref:hypothetical protein n=1 Tax=Pyxidicoccus xibeiensis TaxID=2906759 RepID=UPI0020A75BA0|nr:hypothetical protein [Pyxidicoccus xibeiensis]MCP3144517.1 hypothetical protein [Pyxidicoccus xibeiensis]